jgi:hypothetical protein
MTTYTAAHTIVDLNNGALTHFLNGDYDKAIAMLRMAFESFEAHRIRPDLALMPVPQLSQSQSRFNFTQQGTSQIPSSREELPTMMDCEVDSIVKEKSLRSMQVEPTCSFASSPSTAYSIYNRALVLSVEQDDYSFMTTYQHRTSAIILYNLALVHHNIGIHLGVSAALPHALQLYGMSMQTINQGANLADVQKLLLALLNNMGNIHTHLFDLANTQRCLINLRVVLSTSSTLMAMDEDYLFFFLNAMFQGNELCFAPAA